MPPITPADTLACLKQAFAEFTNRHVKKRPTPTIVADLGTLLFKHRIADAEAAVNGETTPVRFFRISEVIETLRAKRKSDIREKSFRGAKSMQADLERKLKGLAAYSAADGRLLRVVGPIHKIETNEVHLYLDVVEVEVEKTTATGKKKVVRSLSPAGAQMLDAFNRLPEHERQKYDDAITAGARVEVGRSRLGKRRVLLFSFLLLFSLAAVARWIAVRYAAPEKQERPPQNVGSTMEVTAPFRIDELRKIRVTPEMYYNLSQSSSAQVCTSSGVLAPWIKWAVKKDTVSPPFVILRNNEVYEDHIATLNKDFTDYGVIAGQTYQYAFGKRNPATGDIDVSGSIYSATIGTCGTRNRPPIVGIFPDPPGGTAPVTITFDAMYADDKPERGAIFSWIFGDNQMENARTRRVRHEYKYGGEYQVSLSVVDSDGEIGNASLNLSLAGQPAPATQQPPQEPEQFWHGEEWAYVAKVRARTGQDVLLRATPMPIPSGATPVAYRWIFGDCLETAMPGSKQYAEHHGRNCISEPLRTPDIRKRFDVSGLFTVMLEITYDTGETMHRHLGSITVRPNDADYAKRPELRVWYSEPAPTPPDWDRAAKPMGTYR